MRRGTTPIHTFTTDLDLTDAAIIWITYKVGGKIVIDKSKEDLDVTAEEISFRLTQEETLKLINGDRVRIQIRARFEDGTAVASNVMETTAREILKDGVI